uniref:Mesoderm development candidate 2 n=1 Tax=Panagrellus redivivus TaxID=6233 RepID=A0A7E4UXV8_PANRE
MLPRHYRQLLIAVLSLIVLVSAVSAKTEAKKKDVRDFTDADLDKLLDEWEENDDEPLPEDEREGYVPKKSQAEYEEMIRKAGNPTEALKQSKHGQPVMMFVGIVNPTGEATTKAFSEQVSQLWVQSLFNNHMEVNSFTIEDDRVLFMFKQGSQAFDAEEFILKQPQCKDITLEGKVTLGAGGKAQKKEL